MQPGDAVYQYAGFTRAGTGENQLTTQRRGYGLALGIVEGVQEEREIVMHGRHSSRKSGRPARATDGRQSSEGLVGGGQEPRREPGRVVVIDLAKIHLIDTRVSSSTVFGRRDDDQTLASCHYRGVLNAGLLLQTSITRTTR